MGKLTAEEQAELSRVHVRLLDDIDGQIEDLKELVKARHKAINKMKREEIKIRASIEAGELLFEQPELPFRDAIKQYVKRIKNNPNIDSVELESPDGRKVVVE